jgi:hypothetical protein
VCCESLLRDKRSLVSVQARVAAAAFAPQIKAGWNGARAAVDCRRAESFSHHFVHYSDGELLMEYTRRRLSDDSTARGEGTRPTLTLLIDRGDGVWTGLGCIVAFYQHSSTLYQDYEENRCVYF